MRILKNDSNPLKSHKMANNFLNNKKNVTLRDVEIQVTKEKIDKFFKDFQDNRAIRYFFRSVKILAVFFILILIS
jgi:hypothetical protein